MRLSNDRTKKANEPYQEEIWVGGVNFEGSSLSTYKEENNSN